MLFPALVSFISIFLANFTPIRSTSKDYSIQSAFPPQTKFFSVLCPEDLVQDSLTKNITLKTNDHNQLKPKQHRSKLANIIDVSALNSILKKFDWNEINADNSDSNTRDKYRPDFDNHIVINHLPNRRYYKCGRSVTSRYDSQSNNFKFNEVLGMNMAHSGGSYKPLEIRTPRVIGGDETRPGEFPWTASIKLNNQPICGGSLISNNWILTAAHCVVGYNPKNLTIRLGAYRIKDMGESQAVDQPISMFIVHKEYSMPRPFSNDIALLKLSEPVDFTDFIVPICLPYEDQTPKMLKQGTSSAIVIKDSNEFDRMTSGNDDDTNGIVISTKMSDNDIEQCFYKLEQNYLNSIGMGSINSNIQSVSPMLKQHNLQQQPQPQMMMTSNSLSNTNYKASANGQDILSSLQGVESHHNVQYQNSQQQSTINRLVPTQSRLVKNVIHLLENHNHDTNDIDSSNRAITKNQVTYQGYDSNGFVLYSLPWWRKDSKLVNTSPPLSPYNVDKLDHSTKPDTISSRAKEISELARLPTNKDILKDVESISSGVVSGMSTDLSGSQDFSTSNDGKASNQLSANSNLDFSTSARQAVSFRPNRVSSVFSNRINDDNDDPTKYAGLRGTVVGWGWVKEMEADDQNMRGFPSVALKKVELPILRNGECEAWFQSQSKRITLLSSQFCAGFSSGGKDACRGDSGGPMVIEENSPLGRYKLIGIVSAGIGCARPSLPGLYTRVASYLPWIEAQTRRY